MNIALGLRHPESDHKQEISLLFFAEWLTQCHFSTWCLRAMFQDHDQTNDHGSLECVLYYRSQFKQREWKNSEKEASVECDNLQGDLEGFRSRKVRGSWFLESYFWFLDGTWWHHIWFRPCRATIIATHIRITSSKSCTWSPIYYRT